MRTELMGSEWFCGERRQMSRTGRADNACHHRLVVILGSREFPQCSTEPNEERLSRFGNLIGVESEGESGWHRFSGIESTP